MGCPCEIDNDGDKEGKIIQLETAEETEVPKVENAPQEETLPFVRDTRATFKESEFESVEDLANKDQDQDKPKEEFLAEIQHPLKEESQMYNPVDPNLDFSEVENVQQTENQQNIVINEDQEIPFTGKVDA